MGQPGLRAQDQVRIPTLPSFVSSGSRGELCLGVLHSELGLKEADLFGCGGHPLNSLSRRFKQVVHKYGEWGEGHLDERRGEISRILESNLPQSIVLGSKLSSVKPEFQTSKTSAAESNSRSNL